MVTLGLSSFVDLSATPHPAHTERCTTHQHASSSLSDSQPLTSGTLISSPLRAEWRGSTVSPRLFYLPLIAARSVPPEGWLHARLKARDEQAAPGRWKNPLALHAFDSSSAVTLHKVVISPMLVLSFLFGLITECCLQCLRMRFVCLNRHVWNCTHAFILKLHCPLESCCDIEVKLNLMRRVNCQPIIALIMLCEMIVINPTTSLPCHIGWRVL